MLFSIQHQGTLSTHHRHLTNWGFHFKCSEYGMYWTTAPEIDGRIPNENDVLEYFDILQQGGITLRPPVITRFLHSRACRSAIMFGDELSLKQCQRLVVRTTQILIILSSQYSVFID